MAIDKDHDLMKLLRNNPIEAWIGGKGTGGTRFFSYENDVFRSGLTIAGPLVGSAQELIREIVEWRLAEYFSRPSQQNEARQYVLKVSHANGTPILFLPDRTAHPDLPEGWTDIRVNDETLNANFVKIAINVVRRAGSDENVLSQMLQQWFGDDAGKPGTRHQLTLQAEREGWSLRPVGANAVGAVPYHRYRRADIAPLYGLPYSERFWGQGFVRQGQHIFLFVTLDKKDHVEAFQYKDHFLAPAESSSGRARTELPKKVATDRLSETTMSRASLSGCSYEQKRRPLTEEASRSSIVGQSTLYLGPGRNRSLWFGP